MTAATHYQRLGVAPSATTDEIRAAYRNVARRLHPDTGSAAGESEMAAVNEAWRVLSDPGRRALYDRSLTGGRAVQPAVPSTDDGGFETDPEPFAVPSPSSSRRFPIWPFVMLAVLAAIFIVTAGGLSDDPAPPKPDSLLAAGSCVTVMANGDVVEAACTEPHDAVVVTVVGFDQTCPANSEIRRDRQGRGWACLVDG